MSEVTFVKNKLFSNEKLLYTFDSPIQQVLQIDAKVFVLLQTQGNLLEDNRNVFCIEQDGKLRWRCTSFIESIDPLSLEPQFAHYTYLKIKDGELWGNNYFGTHLNRLDKSTGEVKESIYMK